MIRWLARAGLGLVGLVAGLSLYVRLAPLDAALWHIDPAAAGFVLPDSWAAFCPGEGSRHALAPGTDPVAWLAGLDRIALATPRTRVLAGSPAEGRITWVTRSAQIGFPDLTTATFRATPTGPQPCIVARQRFGDYDWGVNAARVGAWAGQSFGLPEPPGRIWN